MINTRRGARMAHGGWRRARAQFCALLDLDFDFSTWFFFILKTAAPATAFITSRRHISPPRALVFSVQPPSPTYSLQRLYVMNEDSAKCQIRPALYTQYLVFVCSNLALRALLQKAVAVGRSEWCSSSAALVSCGDPSEKQWRLALSSQHPLPRVVGR